LIDDRMENFLFSASVVLPLFTLIALGYFFRRINVFTDEYVIRTNKISFRVFMPAMIFTSIVSRREEIRDEWVTVEFVVISSLILVAILMIVIPILEKENFKRGTIVQALFRSNALLFGVPLITNMYGIEGLAPIAVIIATVVPLYNGLTILIFSFFGNTNKNFFQTLKQIAKDLATNPLIIASVVALAVVVLRIRLPFLVDTTINSLAVIAPPIALMSLGGSFRFKKAFGNMKYIIPISIQKMFINPAVLVVIAVMMGFQGSRLAAIMILFSTPVAVTSQITAQEMGADGELAGQITVVTSMVSCFSIFGFIYVLNMFHLL